MRLSWFLLGVSFLSSTAAGQACAPQAARVTELGRIVQPAISIPRDRSHDFRSTGGNVRYIRLLLQPANMDATDRWVLTIRDSSQRILETISDEHAKQGRSVWTRRMFTEGLLLFDLDASSTTKTINVVEAIVMPEAADHPFYSSADPNNPQFTALYESDSQFRRLGDVVGFLTATSADRSWCCSGVAVGENLFLTNWHCDADYERKLPNEDQVWSQSVCDRTFVDFSWDGDATPREFRCVEVIEKNRANDFVLLRVVPTSPGDRLKAAALRSEPPQTGEFLRIVHHPACRPKQLSAACKVGRAKRNGWTPDATSDFDYTCDTEGGSSGAPVFDSGNRVVGIHHLGFALADGKCDLVNKGVAMEAILGSARDRAALMLKQAVSR
jgi:V8-like Glu-specific endopeptidase